jgi:enterochelin esterase-like enzyme
MAAAVFVSLAFAPGDRLHTGTATRGTIADFSYRSQALRDDFPFRIYLPPGYASSGMRYPVIYFLHGLPAGPFGFRNVLPVVRALEQVGRPAILVAPRGARDNDDDPEYLDWRPGRNWETAIASELPRYVDAHFRTIPKRSGRALVGVSAGGYGAVLTTLHRLNTFAVVESWSGYFRPTNRKGDAVLDLGSRAANKRASAHALVPFLRLAFARQPTFFGFYVGRGDRLFRAENVRLDRELTAARVPHLFRTYSGGHEDSLWERYAPEWLARALDHLAPSR